MCYASNIGSHTRRQLTGFDKSLTVCYASNIGSKRNTIKGSDRNNHKTAAQVQATQNLRRSGAAGKHGDRRQKRLKTRGAQKARAMKEYA